MKNWKFTKTEKLPWFLILICQEALILTAVANEIMKIHQNWKIALIFVAWCHYPCGSVPNLNMANCYVCCIDSYPTFRFGTHPQGADLGSYEKKTNQRNS